RDAMRLRRETGLMQDAVEYIARSVAREHPSGPVRSVGAGRQTEYQHPSMRIAERWDGAPPVFPIAIGTARSCRDIYAVLSQPRAEFAIDHFLLQDFQHAKIHLPD